MSPFIKDESVQAVLSAANIVDVVSGYTSLRKRGATHSGLCPFHQEKTPSFTVSADKGLYYCFGCGEGGDVVRFLERMENLSFSEAIEQLGERFGVPRAVRGGGGTGRGAQGAGRSPSAGARQGGHVLPAVPLGIGEWTRGQGVPGEAGTGRGGLPDLPGRLLARRSGEGCTAARPRRGSPTGSWRTRVCWSARAARPTTAFAGG